MFVLLLLYKIPLVIQESYSYNFFLKFERHETDCCKNFRAFFKSQKHSKWSNQSTFQNLNSKFHCAMLHLSVSMRDLVCVCACVPAYTCVFERGIVSMNCYKVSTRTWQHSFTRERALLWSQWSALPVNPSWVPGSCFRWSQWLATPAVRGVMPSSGLFEHCTHRHKSAYN